MHYPHGYHKTDKLVSALRICGMNSIERFELLMKNIFFGIINREDQFTSRG